MHITIVNVRAAFCAYQTQLSAIGYDAFNVSLVHAPGGPYRAVLNDKTGAPGTRPGGLLGHTASEAHAALWYMASTLKFAAEWQR